mmetsp:Transcript_21225/g.53964  ORF Transcript_21225/g.53964 Transcript_21225/m.53964 type:complete len:104 (+) Transcript_21225:184-495(+)
MQHALVRGHAHASRGLLYTAPATPHHSSWLLSPPLLPMAWHEGLKASDMVPRPACDPHSPGTMPCSMLPIMMLPGWQLFSCIDTAQTRPNSFAALNLGLSPME